MSIIPIRADPEKPPPDRGRLLTAEEVAENIGGVSPVWVRANVPHKIPMGHRTVKWYDTDVNAWIESRRT